MGVGKTRLAIEVCMKISKEHPNVRAGYIGSPNAISQYPGSFDAENENKQCLAEALVTAFFKDSRMKLSAYSLENVITKLQNEFGENVAIVLHVDEYTRNIKTANSLLYGAAIAARDKRFSVALVLTGIKPMEALKLNSGSCFTLRHCVLAPLLDQSEIERSFEDVLKITPNVEWDYKLRTLVEVTPQVLCHSFKS
ncbi:hypothetical protein BASA81_002743 [Batrachochytrium salamandrivorans]|nr:hypothetical protein BASA81_002743 [Batrachochytrium salamandrivorans]